MSRFLHERIKSAKGRSNASTRWLQRQHNDLHTKKAKQHGYRSRAAWKLREIDDQFDLISAATCAVEFGAAPGGWLQVITERAARSTTILGVDRLPIEPLEGVATVQCDMFDDALLTFLREHPTPDLILSDLAPNAIGHAATDHLRMMVLLEQVWELVSTLLNPGGHFVFKVFAGAEEQEFVQLLRRQFEIVKRRKPDASHASSREFYVVAKNYTPAGQSDDTP